MQDGCKVYIDAFLHGIDRIISPGHLDYFQEPPLEVGLTQNRETMAL